MIAAPGDEVPLRPHPGRSAVLGLLLSRSRKPRTKGNYHDTKRVGGSGRSDQPGPVQRLLRLPLLSVGRRLRLLLYALQLLRTAERFDLHRANTGGCSIPDHPVHHAADDRLATVPPGPAADQSAPPCQSAAAAPGAATAAVCSAVFSALFSHSSGSALPGPSGQPTALKTIAVGA